MIPLLPALPRLIMAVTKGSLALLGMALLLQPAWGQNPPIDSLQQVLRTLPADTNRVNVLNELARELRLLKDKQCLTYTQQAIQLAQQLGFQAGIAQAHVSTGRYYASQYQYDQALHSYAQARAQFRTIGDSTGVALTYKHAGIACLSSSRYDLAIQEFTQALRLYQQAQIREETANCLLNKGIAHEQLGQFSQALTCFFQCLKLDEEEGNTDNIASDYDQIAIIYKKQGSWTKAEQYNKKAIALYKQTGNKSGIASTFNNLGILYKATQAYEKAVEAYTQAGKLFQEIGDQRGQVATFNNLGEIYLLQANYSQAQQYFSRSLQLGESVQWAEAQVSNLEGLAKVYTALGQTEQALGMALQGLLVAKQIQSLEYQYKFHSLLSKLYKAKGDYAKALIYLEQSIGNNDTLFNLEKSKQIEELQVKYETEKKEQQIALLRKDKALQSSELSRKTFWQYSLITTIAVLLLVAYLIFRNYRMQQRSKQLILSEQLKIKKLEADKLTEMNQLKSRFFSNIAHEFRTPLTLMLGPVESLLETTKTGTREHELLHLAQTHSSRLLSLINQLLDLSRLEAGVVTIEPTQADIIFFLKGITYSFLSLADEKDIQILFSSTRESLVMDFDPDKLEKIMYNLLSNAFKFTPEAGQVEVNVCQLSLEPATLEVSIHDTGVGIAPEQVPFVFRRFYQAGNQPAGSMAGSGIGLALTKELVEIHQGTIRVQSEPGQGSTFTFCIPITHQAPVPATEQPQPTLTLLSQPEETHRSLAGPPTNVPAPIPSITKEAELVLVIEDNPEVRKFIRLSLEDHYQIVEATHGKEGVQMATELVPDLIISDIMMPEMDGYQVCRILKTQEETSHIPVILLTAKAGIESKLEGLGTGADDYLAKPFHTKELKLRILNLIKLRKKLQLKYLYHSQTVSEQPNPTVPPLENAFLARLREVVDANLTDEDFSIEQLSKEIGMSRTQVHRKLKALTNQSASLFIRTLRLQKAKDLLIAGKHNVSEAAYLTGFNSPTYFSTCFTEFYGYPPSDLKVKNSQP